MTSPKPPWRHHYIPQFLLEKWAVDEGCLWQFTRSRHSVHAARKFPKAFGYEKHLYAIPGLPADRAQVLETGFFQHVDNAAAAVLAMLLGERPIAWQRPERSAWSRFVMSLWFRTPENLGLWKAAMAELLLRPDDDIRRRYDAMRDDGEAATFGEAMALVNPDWAEAVSMQLLSKFVDDPDRGGRLNAMIWETCEIRSGEHFLISDQPLIMTDTIGHEDAHIVLPISPTRLFVAAAHQRTIDNLKTHDAGTIVDEINEMVAGQARLFVGAVDQTARPLIDEYFGRLENRGIMARMVARYRQREVEAGR